jgi:hypothetical protein
MNNIRYEYGNDFDLDQIIELYRASTLGERRPIDDRQIVADMMRHANLVVTAWDGDLLVGISRTLTDFSYTGYLGIGIQMIQKTREKMGPRSHLVLLSAPKAVGYYPHVGFTHHNSAWALRATDPFPVSKPSNE